MRLSIKMQIIAAAFLASTTSGEATVGGIRSGAYVGASAGLSNLSGSQDFNAVDNGPAVPSTLDKRNFGISANSLGGSIFAGYGHRLNCYWLAAEISYLFDRLESQQKAKITANPADVIWKVRSTGAFGGAFHFGYIPHENYMVYGIAGLESRRFQMNFQDLNTPPVVSAQLSKKYNSVAFVPGIGVLIKLAKNVSLRGEYKYAFHRSKSISATVASRAIPGDTDTATLKNSPRVHSLQVGIIYNF